ncbi:acyl-CoA dehydrogenase family protein [Yoonia vestfoldensis]|uniref:3-sulfinopropanoyl-CoA desulfinase n=1 Tax=Yoonia vestfoldensis TaxID=245188 RepID=A0A1Y0EDD1_9RHOB|nr:acyl-CoA dehydrogenase family protein [Yoonia vestfoldensis]ARU01594.1 acyl-CoA dehydrogenase, short-chain specific [Yoonia vestfoldensis]
MRDTTFGIDAVREIMRDIADNRLRPAAAEIDRSEAYPFGHAKALADAGIGGMTIPVALGGKGASFETVCVAVEEAAKACGISGRIVVDTNMGAIPAIMTYGTDAQKQRAAELVFAGDKPAICFTEPTAGSDATSMKTRADKKGDGYVLNGVKYWITGAGITKLFLVLAHVYHGDTYQGIGSFMIEDGTDGMRMGDRIPAMGLRGIPEGYLHLEDCAVPASSLLLPPAGLKKGFGQIMRAYNSQRIGAASVALGIAQGAYEEALSYVDKRHQFDRPISEFQGVQWKLADMSVKLRAARLLIHDTARASDPFPDMVDSAQAKIFTAEMAVEVTHEALQLHGAAGYGRDLPLERMARDARMFTIGGGTVEILRNMVASGILDRKIPQTR